MTRNSVEMGRTTVIVSLSVTVPMAALSPFTQKNLLIAAKPNTLDFNLNTQTPQCTIVLQ